MHIINSLSEFHRLLSIPPPLHPLVSVVQVSELHASDSEVWKKFTTNFYTISLKKDIRSKIKYGQHYYDFDSGTMTFVAPQQIQSVEPPELDAFNNKPGTGYVLMFHPDFLLKHPILSNMNKYHFFSYSISEALHLSEKEEKDIADIFRKIEEEYQHIDHHTQDVILAQLDLLLRYSHRFYERQFITRKNVNHDLLSRMENILNEYLDRQEPLQNGLPTVDFIAGQLHISPHYLSDMLRSLTGQSAQQLIHARLIEKAKEYLAATNLSVSEIAYLLGFEYSQSFNKFFKKKTQQTPLKFRQSFN